jgi:Cu(I)/Ag(I) efflux system membrane fusion protein
LPAALVHPYLQVQTALAGDQVAGVATHAQSIATAATALGKGAEKIVAGAKKLGEVKDIAAARTAFGELSLAITDYAQATKSGFGPDVRVAYCPMADKPWLQRDKEIKNPYYGAAMLTCGTFK